MIQLKNLNKYYKSGSENIHVLDNINYTFPDKGLVFILGPSGSGKSTLLNLLGGLDNPDSGEIIIEDRSLASFSKKEKTNYLNSYLGFVFQEYNILKDLNLRQNISLSLEIQGYSRKKIKEKVNKIIEDVELTGLDKRKVSELSGGQKQRIAIARALVKDPKLIIADEPTGNLDSETSKKIFDLFKKISKDCLIIIVTHDEESALQYGDDILRINSISSIEQANDVEEISNNDLDNKLVEDTSSNETDESVTSIENIEQTTNNKLILERAKTPLGAILKLAFKNLWQKKLRFLLILVICAISLAFLSFAIELNGDKLYQNVYTTINNKINYTDIYQYHSNSFVNENDFYSKYEMGSLADNSYETIKSFTKDLTIHKYQKASICYTTSYQLEKANFLYTGYIDTVIMYDPTNNYRLYAGRLPNPDEPEILITDFMIDAFKHFGLFDKESQVYDILNRWYDFGLETDLKIVGVVQTEYNNWLRLINKAIYGKDTELSEYDEDYKSFKYDYLMMNSIIIGNKYFNSVTCEGIENNISNKEGTINFDLTETFIKKTNNEPLYYGNLPIEKNEILVPYNDIQLLFKLSDEEMGYLELEGDSPEKTQILNKIINNEIVLKSSYSDVKLTNDNYSLKATKNYKIVGITLANNYLMSEAGYNAYINMVCLIKSPRPVAPNSSLQTQKITNGEFYDLKVQGVSLVNKEVIKYENQPLLFGYAPTNSTEMVIPLSYVKVFCGISDWDYSILTNGRTEGWYVERRNRIIKNITSKYVRLYSKVNDIIIDGTDYSITTNKQYRVCGIIDDVNFYVSDDGYIDFFASVNAIQNLKPEEKIVVELPKDPAKALKQFQDLYNNEYHFVVDIFQFKDEIESYNVDPVIEFASTGGLIVFTILTIGIMWTVISIEIVDSRKEIGIMRSIGLSGFKVSLIFFIQMFFVNLLAYGISLPIAKYAINSYGANIMDPLGKVHLSLYTLTNRTPIYLAIFVLAITLISSIIPLLKIMSQKIINVINEREE